MTDGLIFLGVMSAYFASGFVVIPACIRWLGLTLHDHGDAILKLLIWPITLMVGLYLATTKRTEP